MTLNGVPIYRGTSIYFDGEHRSTGIAIRFVAARIDHSADLAMVIVSGSHTAVLWSQKQNSPSKRIASKGWESNP